MGGKNYHEIINRAKEKYLINQFLMLGENKKNELIIFSISFQVV